jgi:hypothetical protein
MEVVWWSEKLDCGWREALVGLFNVEEAAPLRSSNGGDGQSRAAAEGGRVGAWWKNDDGLALLK